MKEKEENFKKNFYRTQGKLPEEIQIYKENSQKLSGFPTFFAYLNSLSNLIEKDCAQVMRKYQHSYNKKTIDESSFIIKVHHTPTCRKEELPIQIKEEYLIIEIFAKIVNSNYQEVKFAIKNQSFENFENFENLKERLENKLQVIFSNLKEPKLFNTLKFFDNYIIEFFNESNIETFLDIKQSFNGMIYSAPSKINKKNSNSSDIEKNESKSNDVIQINKGKGLSNLLNIKNPETKVITHSESNEEEEKGKEEENVTQSNSKQGEEKKEETQNKEKAEVIINNCLQIKIDCEVKKFEGITFAKMTSLNIECQCDKCKSLKTIILNLVSEKSDLLYLGNFCSKCNKENIAVMKVNFLHQNNLINLGNLYLEGLVLVNLSFFNCQLICLKCDNIVKVSNIISNKNFYSNCKDCGAQTQFAISSLKLSFPEQAQLKNIIPNNLMNLKKVPKDKGQSFKIGQALPLNGACSHYKKSFRWFKFSCCGKAFPCDICHDDASDHKFEKALTTICGFCCRELNANVTQCNCGEVLILNAKGKNNWEGGKGCRDPSKLNRNDKRKYKIINKNK